MTAENAGPIVRAWLCCLLAFVFIFKVEPAVGEDPSGVSQRLPRPRLFLLKQQDPKAVYVLPLVVAEDAKGKAIIFQFAPTRLEGDVPKGTEKAWYDLYDYGPDGREVASGYKPDLGRFVQGLALPNLKYDERDYPSFPNDNFVPACPGSGRYLIYRKEQKYYVQIAFDNRNIAFGFGEYAPIRDLFVCDKVEYSYINGEPDQAVVRVYNIPGDIRPRDGSGAEIKATVYSTARTALAAVVTFGSDNNAATDESKRLLFDLTAHPALISDRESSLLGPAGAPAWWLLGLPLKYAFFSSNEKVDEVPVEPGAFRRLSSIALHPRGMSYVLRDNPQELLVQLETDFDSALNNQIVRPLYIWRAANLEQRTLFERLGTSDNGVIVREKSYHGPSDWLPSGDFTVGRDAAHFEDVSMVGEQSFRLRSQIVHGPTNSAFRLVFNNDRSLWFYMQESEVSVRQWRAFLASPRGTSYLNGLTNEFKAKMVELKISADGALPNDALARFVLLAATRMKDKIKFAGEANPTTALEVTKWADAKPMVYLSAKDAQEYCEWLASKSSVSVKIRLPNTEEWQRAAAGDDLRRAVEKGRSLRELTWVQRSEGPHDVGISGPGIWVSRDHLVSMFGNVGELVSDGANRISAVGASYRTVAELENVISSVKPVDEIEVSIFTGFRPVMAVK